MPMEKAVILCSGGLNSAVVASVAQKEHALAFLHVKFGHRAETREGELANKQAEHFKAIDRLSVDMPHFAVIGGNARVNRKLQIESAQAIGDGGSNCYVPGLIGTLLSVAFTWASNIRATKVFLGISEDLGPPGPQIGHIYPDYSREYIECCRQAFETSSQEHPISIETPVIDLHRGEIVKLGGRMNTPFELTWSCLSSGSEPCGACLGCATRTRGFLDAAIPDPVLCEPVAAR